MPFEEEGTVVFLGGEYRRGRKGKK